MPQPSSFDPQCPLPLTSDDTIRLAHGGGGRLMQQLIQEIFLEAFSNSYLNTLQDSAVLPAQDGRLAMTTDSYVVQPLFFPGGDIGSLAVHGTINDLAMMGGNPRYLSAGFILEEGLPITTLKQVVSSMAKTAQDCGVQIVCGDTKVVDRGKGDQIFINTTGLGVIPQSVDIGPHRLTPGDRIIVSGDLGAHGMAVLSQRQGLEFSGNLRSDSAPLHTVIADLLNHHITIHCLRDLTRGGLASALNELATAGPRTMTIEESRIPIGEPVRGACEILGLDPLYVANEGRFVMFLPPEDVDKALSLLHQHAVSQEAAVIGEIGVTPSTPNQTLVTLQTRYGTHRILDLLSGEQLPRIC
ncbi:MAG: hydrogenase expression/formation protein HypE [Nitrospirota bacterium]|nr:hydrogenase expression/formation protein HypE [Nitrospirota bacterium]MDH5586038.1 hydrogenase expression/formation protein HypE [Nitrospirota bacterium]MDH5773321.1 hydrogenase expression/formation protein HypE [Nitrospirota bacterium]